MNFCRGNLGDDAESNTDDGGIVVGFERDAKSIRAVSVIFCIKN